MTQDSQENEDGDKLHSFSPGLDEQGTSSYITTLSKLTDDGLSEADRIRIRSAHIQPPHCLITLDSNLITNVLVHIIPAATSPSKLDQLEYVFNIPHGCLNVDTRWNIQLSACNVIENLNIAIAHLRCWLALLTATTLLVDLSWRMLFDKNGWCLIPEAEWVEKFYKFNSQEQEWPFHEKFPKIEERRYTYTMVAEAELKRAMWRHVSPGNYDCLVYPFDLHHLDSHIHPHFVIFNTGSKLVKPAVEQAFYTTCGVMQNSDELRRLLGCIKEIYQYWMSFPVPTSFKNGVKPGPSLHTIETTSTRRTRVGRKRSSAASDETSICTGYLLDTLSSVTTRRFGKGGMRTASRRGSASHASSGTRKSRRIADRAGDPDPSSSHYNCQTLTQHNLKLHGTTDPRSGETVERITRWLGQCQEAAPKKRHRRTSNDNSVDPKRARHRSAILQFEQVHHDFNLLSQPRT